MPLGEFPETDAKFFDAMTTLDLSRVAELPLTESRLCTSSMTFSLAA